MSLDLNFFFIYSVSLVVCVGFKLSKSVINVKNGFNNFIGSFPFVPPSTLCSPQLQSTCHYIVNHNLKIWHVRLEGANNMHSLSLGGTKGKDPILLQC